MTDNNLTKRGFFKDSSIYLSATVISTAITFLTLPIYTRYLSPADYGIVALFLMFGQISSGLVSIGIHIASYRFYFKYKDDPDWYKVINSTNLLFLLFVYMLAGICVYYLGNCFSSTLFDGRITGKLIRLSFFTGCLQYLYTYFKLILTAQKRSIAFATIEISRAIINTIFSLYLIFLHSLTYLALIYAILLTQVIMVVCLIFLTLNLIGIRFSLNSLKKSLRFSYPTTPRQIIGLAYSSVDKMLLNKYTGLASVGFYIFGQKLASLLKVVMDSVGKVWSPFFLEKAHVNTREAQNAIVQRFYELAFFFMLIGLGIIYLSEELIILFTTEEYYPSMYVVPIYVYYYFFGIIGIFSVNQILFAEKMIYRLPIDIVSVILIIVLNILLIPKFGAIGAAIGTTITQLVGSIIGLYLGQRFFPLPLGIWNITRLYLLLLTFTTPVYPIMIMNMNFFLKITIKLVIISVFFGIGIKWNYVSIKDIMCILNKFKQKILKCALV